MRRYSSTDFIKIQVDKEKNPNLENILCQCEK